jgi:dihydrodipicolinate synthase/N-acetylneuraminate lyase
MNTTNHKKYHGVVVPMVTPVKEDLSLDREAVDRICGNFSDHGVAVLVLGTTGESPSVSRKDSRQLVKMVSGSLKGKAKTYACLTGNSVSDNIEDAQLYIEAGADVIVSTLPSYYQIRPEQMYSYYWKLADSLQFPVMIYNIPAVTNMSIPLETVKELSSHPYILGLKDSERDEQRIARGIQMFREDRDFSFFVGYAALSAKSLIEGADGIVPSTGNLVPFMFSSLYEHVLAGNHQEARRLQNQTDEIASIYQDGLSLGDSLQALKVMMSELGLCEPYAIPPLQTCDTRSQEQIRAATRQIMQKYNLDKIVRIQ